MTLREVPKSRMEDEVTPAEAGQDRTIESIASPSEQHMGRVQWRRLTIITDSSTSVDEPLYSNT